MALALAWSRSFADAHDVGMDTPVTSHTSDGPASDLTKGVFVLCDDDDFMSLAEAPEAGSHTDQSQKGYSATVRPVWSENELDRNLGNIKAQLLDQEGNKKNGKVNLQGTQLWSAPKADHLVEQIRLSTEALVWGERHDASLFDLFCEHHMLAAFVVALRTVIPCQVKVQILQSISILVQNTRRTTSFFFLLSGGQLNNLFDDPPDMDDEEILTYFVTFLKSLALRLDAASACLCLAAAMDSSGHPLRRLPIFDCAVKLVGHRDSMVQTAAQTALLSLLRIEDPLVRGAAGRASVHLLAPCLANIVRTAHEMVQLDHDASKLKDEMENLENWLGFVGDLFVLGIPELAEALTQYGFSMGENGFAMWSDKQAIEPAPRERERSDCQNECTGLARDSRGNVREEGKGRMVVLEATSSDISTSDRLEAVLKHCNDKEKGRKRYHVYIYTLMGDTPYEKLATDNVKKATTSLHYNTMMGRTAIMYDQLTGRSTFKREKRGNAYIMKAIRAAQDEHPSEARDAITGDDDLENAT